MAMAYSCIIADPPWQYDDKMAAMKSTGLGASSQYRTMLFEDICALADRGLDGDLGTNLRLMGKSIADDAHLYLWITNPFLVSGYGQWLCDRWGFKPKTLITWVKGRLAVRTTTPRYIGAARAGLTRIQAELFVDPDDDELIADGELVQHFAQGRYTRGTTEHVMFAVRGKCPALCHDLPSAFVYPGRWPGRLHSEKPPVIHEWAERLSPGPRLELFARRTRPGWDAVGDELPVDNLPVVNDD
jgi:N6-adenosine-specific RNA methylase IME4